MINDGSTIDNYQLEVNLTRLSKYIEIYYVIKNYDNEKNERKRLLSYFRPCTEQDFIDNGYNIGTYGLTEKEIKKRLCPNE